MATGYTHEVAERDDMTFNEFVWKCARAMGAFVHMRDDSLNTELVLPKVNPYYYEQVESAKKKKLEVLSLSDQEIKKRLDNSLQKEIDDNKKYKQELLKKKARYENMLAKVKAWDADVSHSHLKEFMIDQLTSSLKFDCGYINDYDREPQKLSVKEYKDMLIEMADQDIEYATRSLKEQENAVSQANAWIQKLMKDVPPPSVK